MSNCLVFGRLFLFKSKYWLFCFDCNLIFNDRHNRPALSIYRIHTNWNVNITMTSPYFFITSQIPFIIHTVQEQYHVTIFHIHIHTLTQVTFHFFFIFSYVIWIPQTHAQLYRPYHIHIIIHEIHDVMITNVVLFHHFFSSSLSFRSVARKTCLEVSFSRAVSIVCGGLAWRWNQKMNVSFCWSWHDLNIYKFIFHKPRLTLLDMWW